MFGRKLVLDKEKGWGSLALERQEVKFVLATPGTLLLQKQGKLQSQDRKWKRCFQAPVPHAF